MKNKFSALAIAAGLALTAFQSANALTVATNTNATDLVNNILGSGITLVGAPVLVGGPNSSGFFTNGNASGLNINSGLLLTSGSVQLAPGPNNQSGAGESFGGSGDSDLNALIPQSTYDATTLEFEFETTGGDLFFNFIFASEEYNEWVGSSYNDVFAFFLNGENLALVPGTTTPVSINNVNNGSNSSYFVDNTGGTFDLQYDGFTKGLTAKKLNLASGTHKIKLAIADAGDSVLDSAVFIQGGSFSDVQTPIPEPSSMLLGLIGLGSALGLRKKKA